MQKFLRASLAVIALSIICGSLVLCADGDDIDSKQVLINGDFEDGLVGWSSESGAEIDSTVYLSGHKSLKLSRLPGKEAWFSASQTIDVEGGAMYTIEVWTKMQNVIQTHCKVQWVDEKENSLGVFFLYSGQDGDKSWFPSSSTIEAPKLAKKASLIFMGGWSKDNLNPGISWFDGIKFAKVEPAKTITPEEWKQAIEAKHGKWKEMVAAKYGKEGIAPEMKEKVVYYDQRHDSSGPSTIVSSFLSKRGFVIKDADQLKSWMVEKIKEGADATVCVLSMGMVPDTITETNDPQCTLRRYMDAGGRIVWVGDVPFFYRSFAARLYQSLQGYLTIAGLHGGAWDLSRKTVITSLGTEWGMQMLDRPSRTFVKEDVTLIFSDVSDTPYTCSFLKVYNPEFPYSGFLRYFDGSFNESNNSDLYRMALYRGKPIEVPVVIQEEKTAKVEALTIESLLRNYRRGQTVTVKVKASADTIGDQIKLSMKDGGNTVKEFVNPFAPESSFSIETTLLASREYTLRAEITQEGKLVAEAEKKIFLVHGKTPKLPMGVYGGGADTEYKANIVLNDIKDHLGECGLIGGPAYMMDEALRYGLSIMGGSNAYYKAVLPKTQNPELQMRVSTGNLPKYHYEGMGDRAPICMGNPINRERINDIFREELRGTLKYPYPAFIKRMFVSDDAGMFGDPAEGLLACYCDYCKGEFKKITGFDAPLAPSPEILKTKGVVNDNDPWYLWMKFRSNNTYGGWNRSMEKAKNEIDPEIKFGPIPGGGGSPVLNPQWALNPPDNYGGVGMASFYYYPMSYVPAAVFLPHSALAMMGNRDKELWIIPQGMDFGQFNDPARHAGLVKNEFYCLLAAGVSGMSFFTYSNMTGTEAWEAMKPLSEIGTKFGPLLLNLKRKTPAVAILASYANASYRSAGADLDLYLSFLKAHIPVDFVADEEIIQGDLKKYKVLVLPDIDYLTRSTYNAVNAFVSKGGIVFTDESCELAIPGARVITNSGAATEVKKVITPEFEVTTPDLIATVFTGGGAQYLMFVNLRTDKPTDGEITLKGPGKYQVYDIFGGQSLKNNQGKISLTIAPAEGKLIGLYPSDIKKVLIETPERCLRGKQVTVKVAVQGENDGIVSALLPVRVSVRDPQGKESEYSDYYAAKDGRLDISFTPALNDTSGKWGIEVKELSGGISSLINFILE